MSAPTPPPLPELHLQTLNSPVETWLPRGAFLGSPAYDPYDLNAPYQRGSVWSLDQKRNLIKSLLMGLPIGAIIVADIGYQGPESPDHRVVDGKQRIEAVRDFAAGRLTVPGHWFRPEHCQHRSSPDVPWDALSEVGRRHFKRQSLPGLTFKSTFAWVDNPAFDPAAEEAARSVRGDTPLEARRWVQAPRSPEEMLVAEAELYLLINFGGVDQNQADRSRATAITKDPSRA